MQPETTVRASVVDRLTRRERAILEMIGQFQFTSKEVATREGVRPGTIDDICESAVRKLGVSSRREAARLVVLSRSDLAIAPIAAPDLPPNESGGESIGVEIPPPPRDQARVSGGITPDEPNLSDGQHDEQAAEHVERPPASRPDLGRPGGGMDRDGSRIEQTPGEGLRHRSLERERRPTRDAQPPPHSGGYSLAGGVGLAAWARGTIPFEGLDRTRQLGAVLLLAAAIVTLAGWIINGSLQTSIALQGWVPSRAAHPHGLPWINISSERHYETLRSRQGNRPAPV